HRLPAGSAVSEQPRVGSARTQFIAQIPGHGGRIDHTDARVAAVVPVPGHRNPTRSAILKLEIDLPGPGIALQVEGVGTPAEHTEAGVPAASPVTGKWQPVAEPEGEGTAARHVCPAGAVLVAKIPGGNRPSGIDRAHTDRAVAIPVAHDTHPVGEPIVELAG